MTDDEDDDYEASVFIDERNNQIKNDISRNEISIDRYPLNDSGFTNMDFHISDASRKILTVF